MATLRCFLLLVWGGFFALGAAFEGEPLLPRGTRHAIRVFTQVDGLPSSVIQAMIQDRQGFLWVGTQDGVARYNGRRFETLPGRKKIFATTLLEDEKAGIWVGTHGKGLLRHDGAGWMEIPWPKERFDTVIALAWAPGPNGSRNLLVGTLKGGLWQLGKEGLEPVPGPWGPQESFRVIQAFESEEGPELWAGSDQGLYRCRQGVWSLATPKSLASILPINSITGWMEQGRLTLAVGGSGLIVREGGAWVEQLPERVSGKVHGLVRLRGELWVGTDRGLYRQSRSGWQHLDGSSGLPTHSVRVLCATGEAQGVPQLWAGSYSGLARLAPGRWMSLTTAAGLSENTVFGVVEDPKDTFWFGTLGKGIARWQRGNWTSFTSAGGKPIPLVSCFQVGSVLRAGTVGAGVLEFRGGTWQPLPQNPKLPNLRVWAILETGTRSGERVLWIGTNDGLVRVHGSEVRVFRRASGLTSEIVMALQEVEEAPGRRVLWVGTRGGGLYRLIGDQLVRVPALRDHGVNAIRAVTDSRGVQRVWIATFEQGLFALDPGHLEAPSLELNAGQEGGLPGDQVFSMTPDDAGRLYVATNRGVARIDDGNRVAEVFTQGDGLPSENCTQSSGLIDQRGRLWIPTVHGVGILNPNDTMPARGLPTLVVTQATCGSPRRPFDSGQKLSYRDRVVRFDAALLSFFRESDLRYRTQLEGLESSPGPWQPEGFKEYNVLPPGTYTFKVWGMDHAGTVVGPVLWRFAIPPPPWASWWARTLYGMTALGMVWGVFRIRIRLLQRHNEELRQKVDEATLELQGANAQLQELNEQKNEFLGIVVHDLRNPLSSIVMTAQLLDSDDHASSVRKAARSIFKEGMDMSGLIARFLDVAAIESHSLRAEEGVFDLAGVARHILTRNQARADSKGQQLVMAFSAEPLPVRGDGRFTKEILDNLLSNAIKFSPLGGRITLQLEADALETCCSVEDQGPGLTAEDRARLFGRYARLSAKPTGGEKSTGLGLSIVKHMVEAMHGRIWVDGEPGQGTAFRFALPSARIEDLPESDSRMPEPSPSSGILFEGHVLLADDNPTIRGLAATILRRLGLRVTEVDDGQAALDHLEQHRDAVDLVLLDGHMPRLDGPQTVRCLRQWEQSGGPWQGRYLPTYALTGMALSGHEQDLRHAGFDGILEKPVAESHLIQVLSRHLSQRMVASPVVLPLDHWSRLESALGGRAGLCGFLDEFIADGRSRVVRMHQALDAKDRHQIEREAHDLKSNAATLSLEPLASLCRSLEQEATNLEEEVLRTRIDAIDRGFAAQAAAVTAYLEQRRGES